MTKSEILQLAVNSGLNPATFKRRGITDVASDEFLVGELSDMIAYYKEMEEKAQRVQEAVDDALAKVRPVIDSKKIDLPDNPSFQDVLKARQAMAEAAS